jgi:hypothetical protein
MSSLVVAMNHLREKCGDLEQLSLDVGDLERRRNHFVNGLRECGYEVGSAHPDGVHTSSTPSHDLAITFRLSL